MIDDPDPPLSINQAATYLQISVRTLRRRIDDSGLPAHRIGSGETGVQRFYRSELDAWVRRAETVAS